MVRRRSDRADAYRRAVVDVLAAVADRRALGREARNYFNFEESGTIFNNMIYLLQPIFICKSMRVALYSLLLYLQVLRRM